MEFLIGIGNSIVGKAAEYIIEPVGRQIGYFFYYKSNVDNLKTQILELKLVKERIEHSVDEATRNGEEIEGHVLNWRSKAEKIYGEAEALIPRDEGQENSMYFSGSSWNLLLRYKQSKKERKRAEVVTSEIQEVGKFNKVSYRPPLQISIKNKGYETFQTRMPTFLGIMEALRNVTVRMIGVWGMGGVGKTVLVKEVARHATSESLFDQVVITTVSQTPDCKKIQQEVAENLGLELNVESLAVRAERLRQRLRKENNIFLILDDIWSKLDLDEIGISFADDQKGCKVVLTSRSEDVLRNDMGVDVRSNFRMEVLSDGEATALFEQIVGDVVKEPEYQSLATQLAKECAGLPLAISTVANVGFGALKAVTLYILLINK